MATHGQDRGGRVGALALGLLLSMAVLIGSPETGWAHAQPVSGDPAANAVLPTGPTRLTLRFDSTLADSGSGVAIYRSDRTSIGDLKVAQANTQQPTLQAPLPRLAPGIYTVAWTSVSGEDGHTLMEFYAFTVGENPPAAPAPALPPLKVGDTNVALRLARGNVGPTAIDAVVTDASGNPITNLQRVIYRFQPVGLQVGEDELYGTAKGNEATTPGFTLGLQGAWQFQVIVRRAGLDDVSATTRINLVGVPIVSAPPAAAVFSPTGAPAASSAPVTTSTAAPALTPTTPLAGTPTVASTPVSTPAATVASTSASPAAASPTGAAPSPPVAAGLVPTPTAVIAATPASAAKLPNSPNSSILIPIIGAAIVVVAAGAFAVRRR